MTIMTGPAIAAPLLSLFLLAPALHAQTSVEWRHDVTGPMTTSSDIAGGAFSPANDARLATPAMVAAMDLAAAAVTARLAAGELTDMAGDTISGAVQQTLLRALRGDASALAAVAAATDPAGAAALGPSLDRLLIEPSRRLGPAVRSFNRVVDSAGETLLASPSPEFLAVHAVLRALTAAALSAPTTSTP
jgi:hypothetical protein